ncbi:unnamed protein product [Oikopleura dioica]|uniref:Uncharacterized protein n=1 Tax=Oikopleura dioica TaxID=34765 RepID=E4XTM3_OIKDI|nr:unnamed protein product [Oikopleura dioica]
MLSTRRSQIKMINNKKIIENNKNKQIQTRSSKRTVSRMSSFNSDDLQGFDPERDVFLEEDVDGDWTEIKRRSSADEIRQAREVKRHSNEIISRVNPTLRLRPVRANTTCGNASSQKASRGSFRARTLSAPSPRCLSSVKSTAITLDLKKISLEWEKKRLNSIPEENKKPKLGSAHRLRALLSKIKSPKVLASIAVVVLGAMATRIL